MTRIPSITATSDVVVVAACALLATETISAASQRPQETNTSSFSVAIASKLDCVVDPEAKNWIKFQNLANQWRSERGVSSSITDVAMLPPYQAIIGMGEDAIRLIIGQLKSEGDDPDQWFWALMAITGANPVGSEDQGDYVKMAGAWIEWAGNQGYAG